MGISYKLTSTISVVVVPWDTWLIDRQLLKVGTAMTIDLCIEIGEQATLQQWVISEVYASYNMSDLKHGLFRLTV